MIWNTEPNSLWSHRKIVRCSSTFKRNKTLGGMMEKCDCPAAVVCLYSNTHHCDCLGSVGWLCVVTTTIVTFPSSKRRKAWMNYTSLLFNIKIVINFIWSFDAQCGKIQTVVLILLLCLLNRVFAYSFCKWFSVISAEECDRGYDYSLC